MCSVLKVRAVIRGISVLVSSMALKPPTDASYLRDRTLGKDWFVSKCTG